MSAKTIVLSDAEATELKWALDVVVFELQHCAEIEGTLPAEMVGGSNERELSYFAAIKDTMQDRLPLSDARKIRKRVRTMPRCAFTNDKEISRALDICDALQTKIRFATISKSPAEARP